MTRPFRNATAAATAGLLATLAACGAFVDTEDLTGGLDSGADAVTADGEGEGGAQVSDRDAGPDAGSDIGPDAGSEDATPASEAGPDAPPPITCTGDHACAAKAPAGWLGPFSIYVGNVTDAPTCGASGVALVAYDSLVPAAPASCPACTCGPLSGASCGKFQLRGSNSQCGAPGGGQLFNSNVCNFVHPLTLTDGAGNQHESLTFGASPLDGGTCTPSAKPTPTKPPEVWNVKAVGCDGLSPTTPGCDDQTTCAKTPKAPFDAKLCIRKSGDIAACPGAPYSNRRLFYEGVTDTRDCAACSCGAPNVTTCESVAVVSVTSDCAPAASAVAPACIGGGNYAKVTATVPVNAACAVSGGAPVGTVVPATPVTVCCAN